MVFFPQDIKLSLQKGCPKAAKVLLIGVPFYNAKDENEFRHGLEEGVCQCFVGIRSLPRFIG